MNTKLQSALNVISEHDFIVLGYRLDTAKWCRSIMKQYGILDEEMAAKLGLTSHKFKQFKTGARDYDLHDWAKLQAIETELGIEKIKQQVEKRIQYASLDNQPKTL